MPRLLLALLITLVAFAAACGDDDDGGTITPTNSAGGSFTATETDAEPTATESDGKTPDAEETPGETTAAPTAPGEVPTAPPTAPGGTPAVAPANESEFLAQFAGQSSEQVECAYNPITALTNCGDAGVYSIDPPIVGQDPQCTLLLFNSTPRVVQCHAIDAGGNPITRNYEIIGT